MKVADQKATRLVREQAAKDQEIQHYAGLVLGLSEQGKAGAPTTIPAKSKSLRSNKWVDKDEGLSEEKAAAQRQAALQRERDAIAEADALAEEKGLRRADKLTAVAERSGSRGRSTSKGPQSMSPVREQPVKLAKVDPSSSAPLDEATLSSSAQIAAQKEKRRASMRAQESEDNAAALEKVAKLEAMAARAGSP